MRAALIVPSAVLLLVSCGGDGGDSSPTAVSATTVAEITVAEVTTTTSATTGRRQESDCTADQNFDDADGDGWGYCVPKVITTTTEKVTTTTMSQDILVLLSGTGIDTDPDLRQTWIDLVTEADFSVESVDVLTFETTNEGTATLVIAVTTGFNGQEYRDEVAWAIAKTIAFVWEDGDTRIFRNDGGKVLVGLRLTVDSTTYTASYDQMVAVADVRVASADWLNQTRG